MGVTIKVNDMQEEMLKIMALKIFQEITAEIRSAEFCAIRANQTSDISKIEQLICIRWVDDDLNSREGFTGLHSLEITNADTIVKVIKDILLHMNISLSRCCSQCCDGCSTTKGCTSDQGY